MDRLEIQITGDLPDADKYANLAAAERMADAMVSQIRNDTGLIVTASVKAVRPGKKKVAAELPKEPENAIMLRPAVE